MDVALAPALANDAASEAPARLSRLVAAGSYTLALHDPLAQQLLGSESLGSAAIAENVRAHLQECGGAADLEAAAASVAMLAAAALSLFVQLNWTGPPLSEGDTLAHKLVASTEANHMALVELEVENEQPYGLLQAPSLLLVARRLLLEPLESLQSAEVQGRVVSWWAARCAKIHQQCLASHTVSLERLATRCMRRVIDSLSTSLTPMTAADSELLKGTNVMIMNLEARPELNGRRGVIKSFDQAKGRYGVSITDGDSMLLKRANLVVIHDKGLTRSTGDSITTDGDETVAAAVREAAAVAHVEMALLYLLHRKVAPAELEIEEAKQALGLELSLVGALGKRTKFQEKEVSQLTLRANLGRHALPRPEEVSERVKGMIPRRIEEEDDTVLDSVHLSEEVPKATLTPIEQMVLLLCVDHLRVSRPAAESTREDMEPYVEYALQTPQSWSVQAQALRLKARLESDQKRRQHRSLMQLQSLVDDLSPFSVGADSLLARHLGLQLTEGHHVDDEALQELTVVRMAHFWGVALQPSWQLRAELARTLAALGLVGEATSLFESLELWDEFVASMIAMDQKARAEEVVRARIATAPTPTMYCYLADLTGESEYFDQAWEMSQGRCARAKLSLGAAQMKSEAWAAAREHLQQALEVKPHYSEAAYCCGVCALKLNDVAAAIGDFRRVVALDPTHYQAWSNLGVLFNKENMKKEALFAFKEACRLRGDSWQLWAQQAVAAVELGYFEQALFSETMAMKMGAPPNGPVASLCAQAVAKDVKDAVGSRSRRLLPRMRELLASNTAKEPTEQRHWEVRLFLENECGSRAELRAVHKEQMCALRAATNWRSDAGTLETFSEVVAQLVELQLESGDDVEIREAKRTVDELVYQASEKLEASPGCEALKMLQQRLNRHIDDD